MARPKGKLIALLAIFAAIGLVTASGAFTTVQAQRTVDVDIAGDASALLALQGTSQYATETSGGDLEIQFTSGNSLNPNATTQVDKVFNVTNNGESTVDVSFSTDDSAVTVYNSTNGPGSDPNVTVSPGSTVAVGLEIDTTGLSKNDDFEATLTINATTRTVP